MKDQKAVIQIKRLSKSCHVSTKKHNQKLYIGDKQIPLHIIRYRTNRMNPQPWGCIFPNSYQKKIPTKDTKNKLQIKNKSKPQKSQILLMRYLQRKDKKNYPKRLRMKTNCSLRPQTTLFSKMRQVQQKTLMTQEPAQDNLMQQRLNSTYTKIQSLQNKIKWRSNILFHVKKGINQIQSKDGKYSSYF